MPGKLLKGLEDAGIANATTRASEVYKSPLSFVKKYPPGTPAREAVVNAYRDVQRTLTIIGVCIAAVCIPLALLMDNVKLSDKRNLVDDDQSETSVEIAKREPRGDYQQDQQDEQSTDEKGRKALA
jgi:SIT family siderophore-iron:H+ symporter-like MFS transporter